MAGLNRGVQSSAGSEHGRWAGQLHAFLRTASPKKSQKSLPAVSLFSGAGVSDYGYAIAGFKFVVQAEIDPRRAAVGCANFPDSSWIVGDVRELHDQVIAAFEKGENGPPALLVATPPCQGMSSSNPSRGRRKFGSAKAHEVKNKLILEAAHLASKMGPRIVVMENVRQIRSLHINDGEGSVRLIDLVAHILGSEYRLFENVVNVADYGIPQRRQRAVLVAIHREVVSNGNLNVECKSVLPNPTHGGETQVEWLTIREWFGEMAYEELDSSNAEYSRGEHPLHIVPNYNWERYRLIADIPPNSGQSAYENTNCPSCEADGIPMGRTSCPECGGVLYNRPIVRNNEEVRLVKGFDSSYRRMKPDEPAPTITTANGHIGSDIKIHPWENRLLSILECADLQTIPRVFDWSAAIGEANRKPLFNVVRDIVGEAFPTYFTYLHGLRLKKMLM